MCAINCHPQVLDAPALADDFYLNLLDWSAQNLLAVGLDSCVYLWSAHTSKVMNSAVNTKTEHCRISVSTEAKVSGDFDELFSGCSGVLQVTKLCDLAPDDQVCSVSWSQRGTYLSVGTNTGEVQVCSW